MVEQRGEQTKPLAAASVRLQLEQLEGRLAPATLTVNSTADTVNADANFTLREAIQVVNGKLKKTDLSVQEQAKVDESTNALGTKDVIVFNLGEGAQKISITGTALDTLSKTVTIDGSAPAGEPTQAVQLDGSAFVLAGGRRVPGLTITAGNCTIKNLTIQNFTGDGIYIRNTSGNTVLGCTITSNRQFGIDISGSKDNRIGDDDGVAGNTIESNTFGGIRIGGAAAKNNKVQGNSISGNSGDGIDLAINDVPIQGNTISDNLGDGIFIDGWVSSLTIGGSASGQGNTISGSGGNGIHVYGTGVSILGNSDDDSNATALRIEFSGNATVSTDTLGCVVVNGGTVLFSNTSTATGVSISGGTVNLDSTANLHVSGAYTMNGGSTNLPAESTLTVNGEMLANGQLLLSYANLTVYGGLQIDDVGIVSGSCKITADVTNSGNLIVGGTGVIGGLHIAADASHGVSGNYTQTSSGSLLMEIASPAAVDQLAIDGTAVLDGILNVALIDGYVPDSGETFGLVSYGAVSGHFAWMSLPPEFSLLLAHYGVHNFTIETV